MMMMMMITQKVRKMPTLGLELKNDATQSDENECISE